MASQEDLNAPPCASGFLHGGDAQPGHSSASAFIIMHSVSNPMGPTHLEDFNCARLYPICLASIQPFRPTAVSGRCKKEGGSIRRLLLVDDPHLHPSPCQCQPGHHPRRSCPNNENVDVRLFHAGLLSSRRDNGCQVSGPCVCAAQSIPLILYTCRHQR